MCRLPLRKKHAEHFVDWAPSPERKHESKSERQQEQESGRRREIEGEEDEGEIGRRVCWQRREEEDICMRGFAWAH